jgi:hypothetical protein
LFVVGKKSKRYAQNHMEERKKGRKQQKGRKEKE